MSSASPSAFVSRGPSSYHGAKGDQAYQGMGRQQVQAHDERFPEGLEAVVLVAGIDKVKKDWRSGRRSGHPVLDRRVEMVELARDGLVRDVLVMRWQRVPSQTERTYPQSASWLHMTEAGSASSSSSSGTRSRFDRDTPSMGRRVLPVWVQDSSTRTFAGDRLVL